MTARTRCGWAKSMECSELLHDRRFPTNMKGAAYKSFVRPAALHENEAWCLKEDEMGILQRTERSRLRAMCGKQLRHK